MESSNIDFNECVKKMGYVKARTFIKKHQINHRLNVIKVKEDSTITIRRNQRLAEAIKLSNSLGEPGNESAVDKIIASSNRKLPMTPGMTQEEYDMMFDNDIAVRRAILNQDLSIPQAGISCLPVGLGDTLFLQLSYLTSITLPRNKLTHFLTYKLPQLSMIHFRYIKEINLSGNKLVGLPVEIGHLKSLRILNLCENNIFRLPSSIRQLNSLTELDLSKNNFSELGDDLAYCVRLSSLNLSKNLFRSIPYSISNMTSLTSLNLSFNMLFHMAVIPKFLRQEDMWVKTVDMTDGSDIYMNAITREMCKDISTYDGKGIQKYKALHSYVPKNAIQLYKKRKMWLSICKVSEWEPLDDVETGWIYYRNNVSGETRWDMPAALDTFGDCTTLEILNLSNNSMKGMCNSVCRMVKLKRVLVQKNRMHSLPYEIGNLLALEHLNVSDNELKLFPPSFISCTSLAELFCQGNQLMRLPDLLGTLPRLSKLDASANRLKILPPSLGYAKLLTECALQDNPLEDPPMAEVLKGLDKLKWYLRQRYMIIERGMPPPMIFNHISIMNEVIVLKPELMMRVRHMIEVNQNQGPMDNILNLQLLGLTEIPKDIVLYTEIKKLRLDFNNKIAIDPVEGIPAAFSGIRLLSMRSCGLVYFPQNCNVLKRINELNLEENLLESLPKKFTALRTLKILNLSKNRLYEFPSELKGLTALKFLSLENNNLEKLPGSLGMLKSLTNLNVSKNRLLEIPEQICDMKYVKKLNVERNDLLTIPSRIREMSLVELKIGHNRIEGLDDDIFSGILGQTIKLFSCPENNLSELPISLAEIDPNALLDAESNPLYSPPPGLMSEELIVIQNYLRVRLTRLNELEELLTEEDFVFARELATPFASEVLEDGTGYLTPFDLSEFDRAVDEYINGDFYKCPASGFEIAENLSQLRDFRENSLYSTILTTTQKVLENLPPEYGPAVYGKVLRGWGRKGEKVQCHYISLNALLKPAPKSVYHPNGRAAIVDIIADQLPPMPFPFSLEMLKDSLKLYSSPYGQIAETEELEFSKCDCIDEVKGRPSRHVPCKKPAVVLLTTIYTQEEADRREEEDEVFMDIFEEVDAQVRYWVQTDEGKVLLKKVCKQRRKDLAEEIALREELSMSEQLKIKAANDAKTKVMRRKENFEKGLDFDQHELNSLTEAIKLLSDADDLVAKHEKRLGALNATIQNCMKMTTIGNNEWRKMAIEDIVQKYCFLAYDVRVKDFRKLAIEKNLRRPWDGLDGKTFELWKNKLGVKIHTDVEEQEGAEQENLEEEDENKKDFKTETEYNWDDTSDMIKYELDLYDKFKRSRGFFGLMSGAISSMMSS